MREIKPWPGLYNYSDLCIGMFVSVCMCIYAYNAYTRVYMLTMYVHVNICMYMCIYAYNVQYVHVNICLQCTCIGG